MTVIPCHSCCTAAAKPIALCEYSIRIANLLSASATKAMTAAKPKAICRKQDLEASAAGAEGEPASSAKPTPTTAMALRKHGGQDIVHRDPAAPEAAAALRSTLLDLLIRPACKQEHESLESWHGMLRALHVMGTPAGESLPSMSVVYQAPAALKPLWLLPGSIAVWHAPAQLQEAPQLANALRSHSALRICQIVHRP